MKLWKPLLIVLGGNRPDGGIEYTKRHKSRSFVFGRKTSIDLHVRQRHKIPDAESWKAARRFIVNTQNALRSFTHNTPIGHICLQEDEPRLRKLREMWYQDAIAHNNEMNPDCQVLVELTWTPLGKEAESTLRTLLGDNNLPARFMETADAKAT